MLLSFVAMGSPAVIEAALLAALNVVQSSNGLRATVDAVFSRWKQVEVQDDEDVGPFFAALTPLASYEQLDSADLKTLFSALQPTEAKSDVAVNAAASFAPFVLALWSAHPDLPVWAKLDWLVAAAPALLSDVALPPWLMRLSNVDSHLYLGARRNMLDDAVASLLASPWRGRVEACIAQVGPMSARALQVTQPRV